MGQAEPHKERGWGAWHGFGFPHKMGGSTASLWRKKLYFGKRMMITMNHDESLLITTIQSGIDPMKRCKDSYTTTPCSYDSECLECDFGGKQLKLVIWDYVLMWMHEDTVDGRSPAPVGNYWPVWNTGTGLIPEYQDFPASRGFSLKKSLEW